MRRRLLPIAAGLVLALASVWGCTSAAGQPEQDYREAMEALYQGDLWSFYQRLAPASYTRDLNALLDKSKKLFSREEYRQALDLIQAATQRVQEQLNAVADPPPQAGLLASALDDVPAALGIESWEKFQQADVESLITNLQQSAIGELLRHPQSPVEWSRQTVELAKLEGDRATLRVLPADEQGEVKMAELVRVEDKWVPAEVALTWDSRMESLNNRMDAWMEAKEQDPQYLKERLRRLQEQLDLITALIPALLQQQMEQMQQP
ncbi:MAG TPA: hypothetical protein VLU25_21900 [Acidobacteriota bacterium]|nr:hypothetical protein [Acidobacteriota bacterium]